MPEQQTLEAIQQKLGEPYFAAPNCLLYNRDCLSALRELSGGQAQLVVTSPPYNIGKEYERVMAVEKYVAWCREWSTEVSRVLTAEGAFWLNLGYLSIPDRAKAVPIPYLIWNEVPLYLVQEVVWNYGAGVAGRHFFSPRNEKLLWYVKNPDKYTFNLDEVRDPNVKYPNQRKHGRLKVNPLGKNPTDVWQLAKVTSGKGRASAERTAHPAQFPIAMIDRIVLACSNPGDVVLDPFMGSGTTAVVAMKRGRMVVGFEVNEKYCEMAAERIRSGLSRTELAEFQGVLFPAELTAPDKPEPRLL